MTAAGRRVACPRLVGSLSAKYTQLAGIRHPRRHEVAIEVVSDLGRRTTAVTSGQLRPVAFPEFKSPLGHQAGLLAPCPVVRPWTSGYAIFGATSRLRLLYRQPVCWPKSALSLSDHIRSRRVGGCRPSARHGRRSFAAAAVRGGLAMVGSRALLRRGGRGCSSG
jgi:hypothetical protein